MKKILFIIAAIFILTGCCCVNAKHTVKCRSFISSYYDITDIELSSGYKNVIQVDVICGEYCNSTIDVKKYDDLCRKHNDMTWNQKMDSKLNRFSALGVDFTNISVKSDANFDETHSAGSSLSDIIELFTYSVYPFILGGYKSDNPEHLYTETYIVKAIPDLTLDDMVMMGGCLLTLPKLNQSKSICLLSWQSEPTLAKVHNITVTMIADDGRVFSDTVQVTWE